MVNGKWNNNEMFDNSIFVWFIDASCDKQNVISGMKMFIS